MILPLINSDQININELITSTKYDDIVDMLIMLIRDPIGITVVHYINQYVGVIYEYDTNQAVGIQIEAFQKCLFDIKS